jgi:predicted enzyme involved in methoxymalonyl-ACP biosynthesis
VDNCPNDPNKTEPGKCGCGVPEGTCSGEDTGSLETEELVRRVAALPDKTLVVFDFDDTLYDHVDGGTSKWASYAKSAVTHLKQRGIAISVCSRNKNSNDALNRALRGLDSQVFNDAFFKSPAFQTDTGLDKSDDIRQAMAYFGIKRDSQVVFFDDDKGNLERVNAATDVISIMVHSNGIDRVEFRDGMSRRLGSGD